MTANEFRRLALSLPDATEAAHMGHPDFRVARKIFATLAYPRAGLGVVLLTPEQQELFMRTVRLRTARKAAVREALTLAWRNRAPGRAQ